MIMVALDERYEAKLKEHREMQGKLRLLPEI